MGSQHSKTGAAAKTTDHQRHQRSSSFSSISSTKTSERVAAPHRPPAVASSGPKPSQLKRFRVNVPGSMVSGDLMTIKLNGILTKILITTPTTSNKSKEATPSCDSTSVSPVSSKAGIDAADYDSVMASTDACIPQGKKILEAKPVIVVHATFTQNDKSLKEQMVDEAMKEIIQETVSCGCNSILGMTVSIKKQKQGFLVKACGTPCFLLPFQVLLPLRLSVDAAESALPKYLLCSC